MAALTGADGKVFEPVGCAGDANAIGELETRPFADDVETLLDCWTRVSAYPGNALLGAPMFVIVLEGIINDGALEG